MFLTWLSDRERDPRFWPFLLRFETTAAGFVAAAKDRFDADATDDAVRDFLERCVAKLFDVESGVVPPDWWSGVQLPTFRWFRDYFDSELPATLAEIRRQIAEKNAPQTFDDQIDREKVRDLARKNETFRNYLLKTNLGIDWDSLPEKEDVQSARPRSSGGVF